MTHYILPIITTLFIAAFYVFMPDMGAELCIRDIKIYDRKKDVLVCGLITAIYSVVAFLNLGDVMAPESFCKFSDENRTVILQLGEETTIEKIQLYTGINTGKYNIEFSNDGIDYSLACELEQNYAELLKWKELESDESISSNVNFVKITAIEGSPWLGEAAFYNSDGMIEILPNSDIEAAKVIDESDKVPDDITYMNSSYFDEIYHVRTAVEHLENMKPYEISHPPLGKIFISIGIRIFGLVPFGWRFMGTLTGILMLPVMYIILKKMFAGILVPACGTILLASDFMHFTQTRIATIDSYAVLFILLMYLFMYCYFSKRNSICLALSGVSFGLGIACKWICIYAGAGLAVLWLAYWVATLVSDKESFKCLMHRFYKSIGICCIFFVIVPLVIYYISYFPYGKANGLQGIGMFLNKEYVQLVIDNQKFMFSYHSGVTATHPYSSKWYQWMFDIRPILYYLKYYEDGTRSSFGAFLNPLLCWGGIISVIMLVFRAVRWKDQTAFFIVIGYLAQLIPWMLVDRIVFEYHYFACSVFLVISTCYIFSTMNNHRHGKTAVLIYTAVSVMLFVLFYPAISGWRGNCKVLSFLNGWLPTWPF